MQEPSAETVLAMRFISYATPLELARRWSVSGEPAQLEQARILLEGLLERFPHSLEIAQQLALVNLEQGREEKAQAVLQQLTLLRRNPHEEVLSRCGRLYRDHGDRYIKYPEIGGPVESTADAVRYYRLALQEYAEAYYGVRFGHYPGINVATLHLLISAFESDEGRRASGLQESRQVARELLGRRANWPCEREDDHVWHLATEGEAALLLEQWGEAARRYADAQRCVEFQPFHRRSMRKQAIRILYAHRRCGITNFEAFTTLDEVFAPIAFQEPAAPAT